MLFDKATYDKLLKEVPTYKLITPSIVSERLKVRGSLARKALIQLENEVTARSGRQPSEVHYRPQIRLRFFGPVSNGDAVKIR